ncbi:MAG: Fur family transcriptional regulator [Prevotella sp.]
MEQQWRDRMNELFERHGVRPTPNRVLVWRQLNASWRPMSLAELEEQLQSLDRSSLFRVIMLFREKGMVHVIEDGSSSVRYELCHNTGKEAHNDHHPHFFCRQCRRTFCMDHLQMPDIELPEGYKIEGVNFVIKGLCPDCRQRQL